MSKKPYPCRKYLDSGGVVAPEWERPRCGGPSCYFALGNDAKYGHVCEACWKEFEAAEQALYAVGFSEDP